MRNRNNRIVFCMNDDELNKLNRKIEKSGLTRTAFLRKMCAGIEVKEQPSADFFDILYQLRMIGNNIHQVAIKANTLGLIDAPLYRKNYEMLQAVIGRIMEVIY
ncbi:MAG: plasmid mobilization relaxosome protein MobC [Ruminococcus sp.]|nr:plasmid mobilization relaxosome protein MobC [Candidatus Copronaster equi]MCQ2485216.1 plasmid mobilization relaxosome protein MobC [Clostridia bacterium]